MDARIGIDQMPRDTMRLAFRLPDASDLGPYTLYCQSERSRFVGGPFDTVQAFEKLAAMIGHWHLRGFGRAVFVDRKTGRALGHVGALHLNDAEPPEITWTLWQGQDEGQGFATEACRAYLDHARSALGFRRMIARIATGNQPSRRLAERIGGKLNPDAQPPAWLPDAVTFNLQLAAQAPQ